MKIYIIRQDGVYWHQILHVGSAVDSVIALCKKMAIGDVDSYHDWVVSEFHLNRDAEILEIDGRVEQKTQNYEREIFRTNKDEEVGNG